jgi:hypothetical protein
MGMWLTHSTRTSALQQTLHTRQMDVALDVMDSVNAFLLEAMKRPGTAEGARQRQMAMYAASNDVYSHVFRHEILLPTPVTSKLLAFMRAAPDPDQADGFDRDRLVEAYMALGNEFRTLLGTAPLTERTMV